MVVFFRSDFAETHVRYQRYWMEGIMGKGNIRIVVIIGYVMISQNP